MNNQLVAIIFFISVWSKSFSYSTEREPTLADDDEGRCTINNINHNILIITDPVYDTDFETEVPYTYHLMAQNVNDVEIPIEKYKVSLNMGFDLVITIPQIDEKTEISRNSAFHHKFPIDLLCNDGNISTMYTTIPVIDTNNYKPFFDNSKYIYNLISPYMEDLNLQLSLNPIIATDYDITNTELVFSIENNDYIDIVYKNIVPGTLNKKHYAALIPKVSGAAITKKIELAIFVTDMGYPTRGNISTLVINPPSPPTPVFVKPFYVGHYYKNKTLTMEENPQLQECSDNYHTSYNLKDTNFFEVSLLDDEIIIELYQYLDDVSFYANTYLAYELTATYMDEITKTSASGSTTIIIELHHDL